MPRFNGNAYEPLGIFDTSAQRRVYTLRSSGIWDESQRARVAGLSGPKAVLRAISTFRIIGLFWNSIITANPTLYRERIEAPETPTGKRVIPVLFPLGFSPNTFHKSRGRRYWYVCEVCACGIKGHLFNIERGTGGGGTSAVSCAICARLFNLPPRTDSKRLTLDSFEFHLLHGGITTQVNSLTNIRSVLSADMSQFRSSYNRSIVMDALLEALLNEDVNRSDRVWDTFNAVWENNRLGGNTNRRQPPLEASEERDDRPDYAKLWRTALVAEIASKLALPTPGGGRERIA